MNAKKQKTKQRRRAKKLAEQAWDAAEDGHPSLATRIICRATKQDPGNPLLWLDQGRIFSQYGDDQDAARALQTALTLAPNLAEACAHLAAIRFRQGLIAQAASLQEQAVKSDPHSPQYAEALVTYRAACSASENVATSAEVANEQHFSAIACPVEQAARERFAKLAGRVDAASWQEIEENMTRKGWAVLPGLLAHDDCRELRQAFHEDGHFAETVVMNKPRFGRGTYRYFSPPLPELVDATRRLTYRPLAKIANAWQELLGARERFPVAWEGLKVRCAEHEQLTPSPILLRYEEGGFNDLHRDIRGHVFFPLQLAVVLSPRLEAMPGDGQEEDTDCEGFVGGEFLFCDDQGSKKSKPKSIALGQGDAIVFCTRARLVNIGGVYGLQPVKHGAATVCSGTRYVLGIPYHEYK